MRTVGIPALCESGASRGDKGEPIVFLRGFDYAGAKPVISSAVGGGREWRQRRNADGRICENGLFYNILEAF